MDSLAYQDFQKRFSSTSLSTLCPYRLLQGFGDRDPSPVYSCFRPPKWAAQRQRIACVTSFGSWNARPFRCCTILLISANRLCAESFLDESASDKRASLRFSRTRRRAVGNRRFLEERAASRCRQALAGGRCPGMSHFVGIAYGRTFPSVRRRVPAARGALIVGQRLWPRGHAPTPKKPRTEFPKPHQASVGVTQGYRNGRSRAKARGRTVVRTEPRKASPPFGLPSLTRKVVPRFSP